MGLAARRPQELPTLPTAFADIPVGRFQLAQDWLAKQPTVNAACIAAYGVSKGAEFALIASTRMPWIKALVELVPSDVVWEGWGAGAKKRRPSPFFVERQPISRRSFRPSAPVADSLWFPSRHRPI